MLSAHDVARYFLSLTDEEAGDAISNLKLQKLLYYAQGFNLALSAEPLFNETLEAWTHGPVVPDIYHQYKERGGAAIPPPMEFDSSGIDERTREFLDEIYNIYGQYSAWKLVNMTHAERPWQDAYNKPEDRTISTDVMKDYFLTLVSQ